MGLISLLHEQALDEPDVYCLMDHEDEEFTRCTDLFL